MGSGVDDSCGGRVQYHVQYKPSRASADATSGPAATSAAGQLTGGALIQGGAQAKDVRCWGGLPTRPQQLWSNVIPITLLPVLHRKGRSCRQAVPG